MSEVNGEQGTAPSIKSMLLHVVLWLPLGFFVWFALASFFVLPVTHIVRMIVLEWLPHAVSGVDQVGFGIDIHTLIAPPSGQRVTRDLGLITLGLNPMLFGYGLPLLFALVMSTPLRVAQRVRQLLGGYVLVIFLQVWGVCADLMKSLAFQLGPAGFAAVERSGLAPDAVALAYQFGSLILPAVAPVVFWMIVNRDFIETVATVRANGTSEPSTLSTSAFGQHGSTDGETQENTRK